MPSVRGGIFDESQSPSRAQTQYGKEFRISDCETAQFGRSDGLYVSAFLVILNSNTASCPSNYSNRSIATEGVVRMLRVLRGSSIPLLCSLSVILAGCSPKLSDTVVLEVGKNQVTLHEYETFYLKSSGSIDLARQSSLDERERFLDLLTNYKLKLQDAYDRNIPNDSDVVSELRDYRVSLATTFITERELIEPNLRKLYDRKREEIRAKHILLNVSATATPEETLAVYNKAMDIVHRLKAGEPFDSLAIQFSEDRSVAQNHGDLYFFTAGDMILPFEDAVYGMQKGDITTHPVRTPFGYHVITVTERQPSRGSIRVGHIMIRTQSRPGAEPIDTVEALAHAIAIRDSLRNGHDFSDLAKRYSEDEGSASKGGELGWVERRRFVQPFDEAAFSLKVGETSDIVRTPFGYHILKVFESKPYPTYAEMREDLKRYYQQYRYNDEYAAYIQQLKAQYNFSFNEPTFDAFVASLDSTKTLADSAWSGAVSPEVRALTLMQCADLKRTVNDAIAMLGQRVDFRNTPLRMRELRMRVDQMAESLVMEAKAQGLEQRDPSFAAIMQEYTDGVVLYKAEQMEVWGHTGIPDSILHSYYDENKSRFVVGPRADVAGMFFESESLATYAHNLLSTGMDFEVLSTHYKLRAEKNEPGDPGAKVTLSTTFDPIDSSDVSAVVASMQEGKFSAPFRLSSGKFAILKLVKREPARQKTFEEVSAELSSMFQEQETKRREQEWLKRVKTQHPVKQYPERLKDAFSSPRAER
jgi:peptidyl-prolyl cis-trans isomerase SurA